MERIRIFQQHCSITGWRRFEMTARDPYLLTPGPATTSPETKAAMLRDWGSWDGDFKAITARVRARLLAVAEADDSYTCVPIQGSGTFAVEAALGTLVPRTGRALVLANGAYGKRAAETLARIGREYDLYTTDESTPPDPVEVDRILISDPSISHVLLVHCETTSGILNPLEPIARIVSARGRALILDAMSTFGALPIPTATLDLCAVIASANKCLEGVPGVGFVIARKSDLKAALGNAHSLSLDVADQWAYMEKTGQWRYTPPTHVIAALDTALDQHAAEGGTPGRGARYSANHRAIVDGLRGLGIEPLIPDALQSPIIVTFRCPDDPNFAFQPFYDRLKAEGFIIYPGKMTAAETFRIGCLGVLTPQIMGDVVSAVARVLDDLGVAHRRAA
jgi:2-aminoethylphosphonate-pyruvate transaminase